MTAASRRSHPQDQGNRMEGHPHLGTWSGLDRALLETPRRECRGRHRQQRSIDDGRDDHGASGKHKKMPVT